MIHTKWSHFLLMSINGYILLNNNSMWLSGRHVWLNQWRVFGAGLFFSSTNGRRGGVLGGNRFGNRLLFFDRYHSITSGAEVIHFRNSCIHINIRVRLMFMYLYLFTFLCVFKQ